MDKTEVFTFLCIAFFVYGSFFFGAYSTSITLSEKWYEILRPPLTHSSLIYPILLAVVAFFICVSIFLGIQISGSYHRKLLVYGHAQVLIFSALWTFVYFGLRNVHLAFANIILVLAAVILAMKMTYEIQRDASKAMIPYLIWVLIAGLLNYIDIVN